MAEEGAGFRGVFVHRWGWGGGRESRARDCRIDEGPRLMGGGNFVCVCAYVCVCVRERERERGKKDREIAAGRCLFVCVCVWEKARKRARKRERERVCERERSERLPQRLVFEGL